MERPNIQGVFAAMITPFGEDGKLREDLALSMMDFYIEKGLQGVFPVSNVGEYAAMDIEERKRLISLCCRRGKGKLLVTPGVTDFNYSTSMALAEHARAEGADAVVLSSPYYYPYSPAYVEGFLRNFLKESPLPVIFYHSPRFAQPVSFEFLLEIMAHPNVIGIKESSADVVLLLRILEATREQGIRTPVMLGFEELTLTGLVHGAKGSTTSCGGIVPELLVGIVESYRKGDLEKARALQMGVVRVTDAIKPFGFPVGYKMAMRARGFDLRILKDGLPELEAELLAQVPLLGDIMQRELAALS